jgi:hypothetical protein
MLMVALVAVGVMNIPAMVGLAMLIGFEKQWRFGETLAKVAGVAALVYAAAIAVDAEFAPGLVHSDRLMDMSGIELPAPGPPGGRCQLLTGRSPSDGLEDRQSTRRLESVTWAAIPSPSAISAGDRAYVEENPPAGGTGHDESRLSPLFEDCDCEYAVAEIGEGWSR